MSSTVASQPENTADNVTGWFANRVADVGDMAVTMVAGIGDVTLFSLRTVGWLLARRQRRDVLMPKLLPNRSFITASHCINWTLHRYGLSRTKLRSI